MHWNALNKHGPFEPSGAISNPFSIEKHRQIWIKKTWSKRTVFGWWNFYGARNFFVQWSLLFVDVVLVIVGCSSSAVFFLLCFHSAIAMNKFDLLQCSLFGMFWMFCWMFCSCHVHHRKHTQWNAHSSNRTKKSMSSDSFWIYLRLPSTSHKSSSDVFHRFICERYISSISWFSFCTMTDDEWCSYSSRHNSWPWPCDRSGDGTMMDERRGPHTRQALPERNGLENQTSNQKVITKARHASHSWCAIWWVRA